MADYSDLIARLEKAEGPDKHLDEDISMRVAGRKATVTYGDGIITEQRTVPAFVPAYTASLDAAIALKDAVLPRYRWSCGNWNVTGSVLSPDRNNDQRAEAATPAIALLIATLKALQSLEQKDANA